MTDFESIDPEFIDTLESTGIIDAYEYVLRKLIDDSLPKEGVYEKCAHYLLEYQKLLLEHNIRAKNAQSFYELTYLDDDETWTHMCDYMCSEPVHCLTVYVDGRDHDKKLKMFKEYFRGKS